MCEEKVPLRSRRRHEVERRRIWWYKRLLSTHYSVPTESDKTLFRKMACSRANTGTPCSCYMCGNPRKHWDEKTRQEKKSLLRYKEGLEDFRNSGNLEE